MIGRPIAILLVEDDPDTRAQVADLLARHGYLVTEAGDAATALARFQADPPDLILLDLGLPDHDGLVVVEAVRRAGLSPSLVLSARDRETDKVLVLEAGADDYLTKPFGTAELQARIGAILRRAGPALADDPDSPPGWSGWVSSSSTLTPTPSGSAGSRST